MEKNKSTYEAAIFVANKYFDERGHILQNFKIKIRGAP